MILIHVAQVAENIPKETYWSVLTSPAHLLAELTITAITDGLLYPIVRFAVKRHDRKEHHGHHGSKS